MVSLLDLLRQTADEADRAANGRSGAEEVGLPILDELRQDAT
jgi:hypothetical protein